MLSVKLVLLFFVLYLTASTVRGQTINEPLYKAIRKVETGGVPDPLCVVGDGGRSIGPFQIQRSYYNDAVKYDPSLKSGGKTYENCKGPGSMEYSKEVMQSYMDRYATPERLGRTPTDEDIARIHNGGPNGYKRSATEKYWREVEKNLP